MEQDWYWLKTIQGFGDAVRTMREVQQLNQDELALKINSSRPTISRFERGADISLSTAFEAIAALGYDLIAVPKGSEVTIHTKDSP